MCAVRGPDDSGTGNAGTGHWLSEAGCSPHFTAGCLLCVLHRGPQNSSKGTGSSATTLRFCAEPGSTLTQLKTGIPDSEKPKSTRMLVIVKQEQLQRLRLPADKTQEGTWQGLLRCMTVKPRQTQPPNAKTAKP